eukprot:CAMPEP_0194532260 /NCGR_PEP_ID=MMETSP0253-20130528/69779_1 /TAXON_ID=2966 /ORGANISM="Noctiluca scintillans" /LENGTH=278 /DNA_ID=CAMNT_0039377691 /DNA_START=51 /DNA_END=883 /DNA_ORIENTATION=+
MSNEHEANTREEELRAQEREWELFVQQREQSKMHGEQEQFHGELSTERTQHRGRGDVNTERTVEDKKRDQQKRREETRRQRTKPRNMDVGMSALGRRIKEEEYRNNEMKRRESRMLKRLAEEEHLAEEFRQQQSTPPTACRNPELSCDFATRDAEEIPHSTQEVIEVPPLDGILASIDRDEQEEIEFESLKELLPVLGRLSVEMDTQAVDIGDPRAPLIAMLKEKRPEVRWTDFLIPYEDGMAKLCDTERHGRLEVQEQKWERSTSSPFGSSSNANVG